MLPGTNTCTGGFMLYDDLPLAYDVWDAEIYHFGCKYELQSDEVEVVGGNPLRASLKTVTRIGESEVTATISLDAIPDGAAADWRSWIRFDVVVDWHEKHKFVKFALRVDIHAPTATYSTQYGTIERLTHRNATQD
ncbi:Glycoside hydrolase, 38 vacuolar alpha mannosidase [Cryptotrichosporon argae]